MKALLFSQPGLQNLTFGDYQTPDIHEDEVLVETKCMGVNPIDYYTVTGLHGTDGPKMKIFPYPHIPGTEISGEVKRIGFKTKSNISEGDRVIIYNRLFDGTCVYCRSGLQNMCVNGGMIGIQTNGGFSEYVKVPYQNIIKIPDDMDWELASALPIAALTAYNAIIQSGLKPKENLLIFGGSGNTGLFSAQIGKSLGAITISVSSKEWLSDYGVDHFFKNDQYLVENISRVTNTKMIDVVINSLGEKTWKQGMATVGKMGRVITFGVLTGGKLEIDGRLLYNNQITIKGTTGGTVQELIDLIELTRKESFRTRIWKKFSLEDSNQAIEMVFDKKRDGRIIITNY
jgi:NADPH:quinone reductase-like Zn-dependent oxidoreductase